MDNEGKLFLRILMATFVLGVVFATYAIVQTATTSGAVDYCYYEYTNGASIQKPVVMLKGHRPWRSDVIIGVYDSTESAASDFERVGCKNKP